MSLVEFETVEVVTESERRARILEAAALEVEVRGWTQGEACDDEGRVCAVGALKAALGIDPRDVFTHWLGQRLDEVLPIDVWGGPLAEWNDDDGRTADEVTFLLRWRAEEIRDGR